MSVTVYTTQTCPYCRMAKQYLTQHGVPFIEKDVSRDRAAAAEMARMGQQGVPVIDVNGQIVVGFDRARLDQLLSHGATGEKPQLGAAIADASRHAPAGSPSGAYIGRVQPGSPAARAGLQPGDIIVALAGQPVSSASSLEQLIGRLPHRQRVPARVYRQGQTRDLTLDL